MPSAVRDEFYHTNTGYLMNTEDIKNGLVIDAEGNKSWWKNGVLHREDGPAVEWENGHKSWWIDGVKLDGSPKAAVKNRPIKKIRRCVGSHGKPCPYKKWLPKGKSLCDDCKNIKVTKEAKIEKIEKIDMNKVKEYLKNHPRW